LFASQHSSDNLYFSKPLFARVIPRIHSFIPYLELTILVHNLSL
jgi:hypothetical protein